MHRIMPKPGRQHLTRRVLLLAALGITLAVGLVLALTGAGSAQQPIRIGLQGPFTGPWALEGEMARQSVEVVADQINALGGVLGRPIEIVFGDDQGEPRQSALTAQRIAIVHDNTTFAAGLAEAARNSLAGAQIVFYDAITPGDRDFTATVSRLRQQNPDVVYFTASYPEAGLFLRQMRDAGVDALFVGGNAAINSEFIEIAGLDVAAGALVT